jgi:hypothetical protein
MISHRHGSTMEHIKLHRSKCACLIKTIISPALKTDLVDDFQNKKYAIIIDESSDISTQKHLCILVWFLSDGRKEIVTGFIGLIPVQDATGGKIFNLVDEEIKRCGQSLANCIGFATDGASNMVGCNNSVWSRLKSVSAFCVQLNVAVIHWPSAFKMQYPSYHQILDFYCQKYPVSFAIVKTRIIQRTVKVMNSATEFEPARTAPLWKSFYAVACTWKGYV